MFRRRSRVRSDASPSPPSPSPSPSSSSTIHIDLTRNSPAPCSPSPSSATVVHSSPTQSSRASRHHHHHHHASVAPAVGAPDRRFTTAFRRIHTRRERIYSKDCVMERLSHLEERPTLSPIAWKLSNLLLIVLALVVICMLLHVCYAFFCDVMWKTTGRAHELQRQASQCRQQMSANRCEQVTSPALSRLCLEWRQCASRGDSAFRYAFSLAVFAEILADMFNAFANGISSGGVVVASLTAAFTLYLSSLLFRTCVWYNKQEPAMSPISHEQYWRRPSSVPSLPPPRATRSSKKKDVRRLTYSDET